MPQRRTAAIVGIHEYPQRIVGPGINTLHIKAVSAAAALADAGLSWKDVDAVYDTGETGGIMGLAISEYFGFKPRLIDTTNVGGSSFEFQASHAAQMVAAGRCNVALLTYGSLSHTDARAIGTAGATGVGPPNYISNMEDPWGVNLIANYAMVKNRHMHQYGSTDEQFAAISVVTRRHAMRNPDAVKTLNALKVPAKELTVAEVLSSRLISYPLHLLECCLVTDGGGAIVIASPAVARNTRKKPTWIIGSGEATKYRENNGDITVTAGAQSGPAALADAGIKASELDLTMIYDSFTITVLALLEDIGLCKKGEGGPFVSDGRLHFDSGRKPALNTDGGGLSSNHPGMRGIYLMIEAVRQFRRESTAQLPNPKLAIAVGNGGYLGSRHATAAVVLAAD